MKNRKLAAIAVAAVLTGNLTAAGAGAVRAENQPVSGASPSVESGRSVEEGLQLLKENLERLIAENADLKAKNVSLQADKVQLQNELSELQASVEDLEQKLKEYEDQEKARLEAEKQEKAAENRTPSLPYPESRDKNESGEDTEEDASGSEESKEDADPDAAEGTGEESAEKAGKASDASGEDEAGFAKGDAGETEENGQTDPAGKEASEKESKKTDPEETDETGSTSSDDPAGLKKSEAGEGTKAPEETGDDAVAAEETGDGKEAAEGTGDDTEAAKEAGDEAAGASEGEKKTDAEETGEESAGRKGDGSISWTSVDGEESIADETDTQADQDEAEGASGSEKAAEGSDDSDLVSMEPVSSDTGNGDEPQGKDQVKEPVSVQNDPAFERKYIGTDMIVTIQNTLIENGYPCGRIDGVLGQGTASQISAWEADNGLTPTGAISDALVEGLLGLSLPGSSDVVRSSEFSNVPMDEAMILSIDLSDQGRSEDTYQVGVEVKSTVPATLADAGVTLVYYDQYGNRLAEDTLRCGHTLPYGQSWKDTSVLRGENESWDVAAVGVSSCTYRLEKPDAYGFTDYSIDLQTGLVTGKA